MTGVLDVLRSVGPHQDEGSDRIDATGVLWVRGRIPRWTSTPPKHAGWYAVRWRRRSLKARAEPDPKIVYVDGPREAASDMEWSDRAYQWPLEPEALDEEAVAVKRLASKRAWGRDTTPGQEIIRLEEARALAEEREQRR